MNARTSDRQDLPIPLGDWPAASAWAAGALAERGLVPVGPPHTLKVRPWSSVARLQVTSPTTTEPARTVWFKANGPGSRYEPALLALLAEIAPQWTVPPIAVDTVHGWSLLADGGPSVRDLPSAGLPAWGRFVTAMARLQVAMAEHVDRLVAAGVPHQPTTSLPEHLDALLADDYAWASSAPGQRETVRAVVPGWRRVCAELGTRVIPDSIQHNDLHDGNVLGDCERFFDWGDAYVGRPFGVLLVTLRRARQKFGLSDDDPALGRLRDAYLEPWNAFATREVLHRELDLALVAARICYALSWQRALFGAGPEARQQWDGSAASLAALTNPHDGP